MIDWLLLHAGEVFKYVPPAITTTFTIWWLWAAFFRPREDGETLCRCANAPQEEFVTMPPSPSESDFDISRIHNCQRN